MLSVSREQRATGKESLPMRYPSVETKFPTLNLKPLAKWNPKPQDLNAKAKVKPEAALKPQLPHLDP